MANPDRSKRKPVMELWEYIYVIKFQARPLQIPKKWFETDT